MESPGAERLQRFRSLTHSSASALTHRVPEEADDVFAFWPRRPLGGAPSSALSRPLPVHLPSSFTSSFHLRNYIVDDSGPAAEVCPPWAGFVRMRANGAVCGGWARVLPRLAFP